MKRIKTACLLTCLIVTLVLWSCDLDSRGSDVSQWDHSINFDWKFAKGVHPDAIEADFDDDIWEAVNLPHDWAISGPFGPLKSDGNTGKLPWKGEGWYRKSFDLPADAEGKRLQFLFDGIMASPEVWLNGVKVGSWTYGYNSFWIDATEAARFGQSNLLVIKASTKNHSSRWYPGAGIYRKIGMRLVDAVHIPVWGVRVSTPDVKEDVASIRADIKISNQADIERNCLLDIRITDPSGQIVFEGERKVALKAGQEYEERIGFGIEAPSLWDVDEPNLYTCIAQLKDNNEILQSTSTSFGIRNFKWTADDGFYLNGRRVQIKGVNLHHDQGPLGAAFFPRAMERQLEIMKEMGVNAIRTSHNAGAPEVLDLCDRMGIIVFNELFDKYGPTAGVQCSTAEYVDQYAEAEVRNFVLRDRNHPSVFLWSIGNEIPDILTDADGLAAQHVTWMVTYFKRNDLTRPITMGCHIPSVSENGQQILDALENTGWNYARRYASTRKAYEDMPLSYSESASAFGTRGAYKLPLPTAKDDFSDDGEMNAYMLTSASWSDIPEVEFEYMRIDTFIAGEFVWTGFDYLGEPTPVIHFEEPVSWGSFQATKQGYDARSSYFGIVDLAGLPKDSYFNYRSHWNENDHTIHLTPHWNWKGREEEPIPVFLYTDGDEAELFLNGKSLGRRKKADPDDLGLASSISTGIDYVVSGKESDYYDVVDAYRLRWLEVPYEAGELKAVVYLKGEMIGEAIVKTAGESDHLRLVPDRIEMKADGMDLCYVNLEMVDKNGVVCPLAMDNLKFEVSGSATLMGVANGNQMGHDAFTDFTHPLFYGKAVAVLRSLPGSAGEATLKVTDEAGKIYNATVSFTD